MKAFLILLFLAAVPLPAAFGQTKDKKQTQPDKRFINPDGVSKPIGYTHAISVGGGRTIFLSGQVALNSKGELVGPGDLREQTIQAFENMRLVLAAAGATFSNVVKISYFVKDYTPAKVPIIREVRDQYLPKDQPSPASTLVGVQSLFRDDVLIEIEAIAVVPQ
jgi:enamine deaminase RidA (YjgF/YER057c/UK114 family)